MFYHRCWARHLILILIYTNFLFCKRPNTDSEVEALGSITKDNQGRIISSVLFVEKRNGQDTLVFRKCSPVTYNFKGDELEVFGQIAFIDKQCKRSSIAEEKTMPLKEVYTPQLNNAVYQQTGGNKQATDAKVKNILDQIKSPEPVLNNIDFSLATMPFMSASKITLNRRNCQTACDSKSCWSCQEKSNRSQQVQCGEEDDARLTLLNKCDGSGNKNCDISCVDLRTNDFVKKQTGTNLALKGECGRERCNPGDYGVCYSCRCWLGALDFKPGAICSSEEEARRVTKSTCPSNTYCEPIYGQKIVIEKMATDVRKQKMIVDNAFVDVKNKPKVDSSNGSIGLTDSSWNPWNPNFYSFLSTTFGSETTATQAHQSYINDKNALFDAWAYRPGSGDFQKFSQEYVTKYGQQSYQTDTGYDPNTGNYYGGLFSGGGGSGE